MTALGKRLTSAGVSLAVLLVALVFAIDRGAPARADGLPSGALFVPVTPYRLFDTRDAATVEADTSFEVAVVGESVPETAVAVVLNLAYVNAEGPGFVTVWPTGEARPDTSTLNKVGTGPAPNSVTVKLGTSGQVSIFNQGSATDMFADVSGYYVLQSGPRGAPGPVGPQGPAGRGGAAGAVGEPGREGPRGAAPPVSSRGGQTLTALVPDVLEGVDVEIGVDGRPLVAYLDANGSGLWLARCDDVACRSATAQPIASATTSRPAMAIGSDGLAVFAFRNADDRVEVLRCTSPDCTQTFSYGHDMAGPVGDDLSIVIGSDGVPLVVGSFGYGMGLWSLHCATVECITTLSNGPLNVATGGPSDHGVAIGVDGYPVLAFRDSGMQEQTLVHCFDMACNTIFGATFGGSGGSDAAMTVAIGGDGRATVAFYAAASGTLAVAHCNDDDCLSPALATIATDLASRVVPVMAIGSDGLPLILWADDAHRVVAAHCYDDACTTAAVNAIDGTAVDDSGLMSLAIGTDGLPLIAYRDREYGQLVTLHCSNPACLPFVRAS